MSLTNLFNTMVYTRTQVSCGVVATYVGSISLWYIGNSNG
jgi:hypothetical protein